MMTTEIEGRHNIWRILWSRATSSRLLGAVLLLLAICLAMFLFIPQVPSDPQEATVWMSQIQTRFGSATGLMDALGLFSMWHSPLLRLTLAVLAFILLVRTVDSAGNVLERRRLVEDTGEGIPVSGRDLGELESHLRRRGYRPRLFWGARILQADRWPWADIAEAAVYLGCLFLLLGFVVGDLWGWQEGSIQGRPVEMVVLPDGQEVLVADGQAGVGEAPPGVRLYLQGTGPELTVESETAGGSPLGLQQAPDGVISTSLQLRLTEAVADTYAAIPSVGLVIRIVPAQEESLEADSPLLVQIFRTPSGEMAQEVVMVGDTSLFEDDIHITVARSYYLVFSASNDPGYWFKVIGLIVTAISLLIQTIWLPGRFWVRRDDTGLGGGELPADFTEEPKSEQVSRMSNLVFFVPLGVLGAFVAGMAIMSLARTGSIWNGSVLQVGLSMLLIVWAAVWMVW